LIGTYLAAILLAKAKGLSPSAKTNFPRGDRQDCGGSEKQSL
jgi:hypothetical protein